MSNWIKRLLRCIGILKPITNAEVKQFIEALLYENSEKIASNVMKHNSLLRSVREKAE